MKQAKNLFFILMLSAGITFTACKGKSKESNDSATHAKVDTSATNTAPVEVAPDQTLQNGVRDATKDFPDVNASVDNGEITLTGHIKRERFTTLMQSLNALHPKKINNNLTIN